MTAVEITAAGYANLNIGGLCAAWGFLEFQTSGSVKILRIPKTDPRVSQVSVDTKKVVYTVLLTGSDADLAGRLPLTFGLVGFKASDSDGASLLGVNTFDEGNATMSASTDTVNTTVTAGIP